MIVFGFPFVETAQAQLQGAAGNVRVNIVWHEDVDLDLYVTDPCGNKFGFDERTTADCGSFTGRWDHDDRGHESRRDDPNAENIVWSNGAPAGRYQVHVNHYRGSVPADYTVRIFLGDREQPASTHVGTIADEDGFVHVADFEADESVNLPVISIRPDPDSATIDEGGTASFTLTAEPPPADALEVSVTVSQTGDFVASDEIGSQTVTIGPNGRGTLSVDTDDDATDEANGTITMGVPPKLIIFNGVLGGARAPHCQERRLQRDRFATTMTILNRSDCFGAARAGSEWPARHAHSSACPNA